MATIKEFRGLRYNKNMQEELKLLICPPYDIISDNEALHYLNKSEYNIIRLELPKGKDKYYKANKLLSEWINEEILVYDNVPCIYIYEQEFIINNIKKNLKGLICLVKLEDFSSGVIIPHENTISKAKEDRLELLKSTQCNFSSVYSLYDDENNYIQNYIDLYSSNLREVEVMDDQGVTHRLWKICEISVLEKIKNAFNDKKLYIADGHHRYETALRYNKIYNKNYNYVMMYLVDMKNKNIEVLPTHRLIKNIANFDFNDVLKKLCKFFDIAKFDGINIANLVLNKNTNHKRMPGFIIYGGGNKCFLATLKVDKYNSIIKENGCKMSNVGSTDLINVNLINIDTYILEIFVFKGIFRITENDIDNGNYLLYTKDINILKHIVDKKDAQAGFIVRTITPKEICMVAELKQKLPRKSSYFYPKPITGLIINNL